MLHHFEPVIIWETIGVRRPIRDVERAAEWLMERWPPVFAHTLEHRAAQIACLEAWEGRVPADYARAAFVVAAREAGILVEVASEP